MPSERVERLALQVVGGVVGRQRRACGACAVDHDEAESDEPERDDDEQVILETPADRPPHSASTSCRNLAPRSSKFSNWS